MRQNADIDYTADQIADDEVLIRLLCTPRFYNKETKQVNIDAFDLRMLGKKPETYVSLGRKCKLDSTENFINYLQKGHQIWNSKKVDSYVGYGEFVCSDARNISGSIEVNPLNGSDKSHVGMFYIKDDNDYYAGPLPKNDPKILEMLLDLAIMLSQKVTELSEQ